MKEKIIEILREHPGLRKREIAACVSCHHFTLITLLHEMEEDGLVSAKYHHDPAQMEFYDEYYVTNSGLHYLTLLGLDK